MHHRLGRFSRLICSAALIALSMSPVAAMWIPMTLDQLVSESALIVVGEVVRLEPQRSGPDVATIRIDNVLLAKQALRETKMVRLLVPAASAPRTSKDVMHGVGARGIWFLKTSPVSKETAFLADHPHRLQPLTELARVRSYIETRTRGRR